VLPLIVIFFVDKALTVPSAINIFSDAPAKSATLIYFVVPEIVIPSSESNFQYCDREFSVLDLLILPI
jgi:hypothetical protein